MFYGYYIIYQKEKVLFVNCGRGEDMATIKDVAKETGLSVGTVSRVLNNRGYISGKTRDLVEQAMRKLNYQPNEIARSLSKSSSSIVGLIVPTLINPYFSSLVSALEDELESAGFQPLLFISDGDDDKEMTFLAECRRNRVCGIILLSGNFKAVKLADFDVPLVSIERTNNNSTVSIICDNYEGGLLATEHLLSLGCRRIVLISGEQDVSMPADSRSEGYGDAMRKMNLEPHIYNATKSMFHSQDYYSLIDRVFEENPDMDGLFVSSDVIAAEAIQVARKRGKRIPEDIKLCGFDDSTIATMTSPTITSIRQPISEMARIAVSTFKNIRGSKDFPSMSISVKVSLVKRESTMGFSFSNP